jgi:hypothetical protein
MRQLERPDALAKFPSDDGRLLLELLIACGLRLKDARWLPFDCIVRDDSGNPYPAWLNRKIHDRPAFFPLSTALADRIAVQQSAVYGRFPNGTPWLFPAMNANLDGSKPVSDRRLRDQLKAWLDTLDLRNEYGRPVKITFHQFRHTLATRLINANVPQHVVQQLLDHMSPQMTAVYARLLDKTVRQHWERATKVNADGRPVQLDPEHPLADAAWMKLSMVRAKVTLPNGYCGAPIQRLPKSDITGHAFVSRHAEDYGRDHAQQPTATHHQEHHVARRRTDPRQVTFQAPGDNARSLAKPRTRRAPARTKAVRWTDLINTGTRLDEDTIARLDDACERTGLGVQGVWEEAINYYCDRLDPPIPAEMPPGSENEPIPRPSQPAADPESLTLITARLTPNTRARLVAGCHQKGLGGQEFIPAALNAWFDQLDDE